jgi:hypothetical protein
MPQFNNEENDILRHIEFEQFVCNHLDFREMHTLSLMLQGFTTTKIAAREHVSRRYITRVIHSIRDKAHKFLVPT